MQNQDQNQRAFKLAQQQPKRRGLSLCFKRVWSVLFDTALSVCLLEAVIGSVQHGNELFGRKVPIGIQGCRCSSRFASSLVGIRPIRLILFDHTNAIPAA